MNIKHDYYIKKLSISEIARIYGIDRKTVRRYLKATDKPKYTYKKGIKLLKVMPLVAKSIRRFHYHQFACSLTSQNRIQH